MAEPQYSHVSEEVIDRQYKDNVDDPGKQCPASSTVIERNWNQQPVGSIDDARPPVDPLRTLGDAIDEVKFQALFLLACGPGVNFHWITPVLAPPLQLLCHNLIGQGHIDCWTEPMRVIQAIGVQSTIGFALYLYSYRHKVMAVGTFMKCRGPGPLLMNVMHSFFTYGDLDPGTGF